MLFTNLALTAAAALVPLAHTTSYTIIVNHCLDPIYLWSIGSCMGAAVRIDRNANYTKHMHYDPVSGGVTLIIGSSENDHLFGSPQALFVYTVKGIQVLYDLTDIYGDLFRGRRVALVPSDSPCRNITWENGIPPGGNRSGVCMISSNLTLTVC